MTSTLIGQVATTQGLAQQYDAFGNPDPFRLPAAAFRPFQPKPLPVCIGHEGWQVGEVASLVRSRSIGLVAIARIDVDLGGTLDEDGWFLSGDVQLERTATPLEFGHARLREIALTRSPAALNTRPVRWRASDIAIDGGKPGGLPFAWMDAWDRAHASLSRYHSRPRHWLDIIDLDPYRSPAIPGPNAHDEVGGYVDGKPFGPAVASKVRQMLDDGVALEHVARFARSFVA